MWSDTLGANFALGNSLFGAVKLTKNSDSGTYKYSGYGIGIFSLSTTIRFGKNVATFAADMSSSVHTDNKKKDSW